MRIRDMQAENPAASRIPFKIQIDPRTIVTDAGEYLQIIRMTGVSFESADDEELNNWHNRLNVMYRNIGSPHIMLYHHIVRRVQDVYPHASFEPGSFAEELDKAYQKRLSEDTLMINELYLTVMYKPLTSILTRTLVKSVEKLHNNKDNPFASFALKILSNLGISSSSLEEGLKLEQKQARETLEKTVEQMLVALARYDPEVLETYEYTYHNELLAQKFTYTCSEPLEFLAFLINGEWQRMPLPKGPISEYLSTSRQIFGTEAFELWTPTGDKVCGAVIGIKEPPSETCPGFINQILTLPFPYVVTQSFDFQYKETAKTKIRLQRDRFKTANDEAISQHEGLNQALDDVTSNVYLFGDHHFNMIVYGQNMVGVHNNLNAARTALADGGMVVTREDAANEAAFWAQLPGNAKYRPRVSAIHTRNFASFAPFHNFPQGRSENNHWGPALTMFRTSAGSPYYFSFHASDPTDPDGGSKKDIGHTLILGPTGSGKTVLVAFCQTMLQKFGCTTVALTKDYDTQICIQANGGIYFPLKQGRATGFNPFSLEPNPENKSFVQTLVKELLRMPDHPFTPTQERELSRSLDIVWSLPAGTRQLRHLEESLNVKQTDGLHQRIQKWIKKGELAWVFDNTNDGLQNIFATQRNIGFDITSFLDLPEIRTPINMYLFHRVNDLMDGRRLALFISEFWKALDDPALMNFAKDGLKTQRKKNAFTVMDSQSPSDALNSPISATLIEQTATKFLLPNPDANLGEYIDGLNCSDREAKLIKEELEPGSRMFLIKQGRYSVVAQLDLKGMHYFIRVLSSNTANIELVNGLQEQLGIEVNKWLPAFKEQRLIA